VTKDDLIAFEDDVARRFDMGEIASPVHLAGGNEDDLIAIFKDVRPGDWKFCTYRSHPHALLSGIPAAEVMEQIVAGNSMHLMFPEHRFFSSAIVGGCLPIAVGVAYAIKRQGGKDRVWCFCGDMAASIGTFHDAFYYASGHDLPIRFVIEDNGHSVCTPTAGVWNLRFCPPDCEMMMHYLYKPTRPHWSTKQGRSF
jgi:TPP-dependent pyruvate/acetoin dehydrogenase alpha subunit